VASNAGETHQDVKWSGGGKEKGGVGRGRDRERLGNGELPSDTGKR